MVAFIDGASEADLSFGDFFDIVHYLSRPFWMEFAQIDDTLAPLEHGTWELSYDHPVPGSTFNAIHLTYVQDPTSSPPPSAPRAFALHPARPNPFHARTEIVYELPRPAPVELRIYDVAGRLVRTLESGRIQGPGTYRVIWSGETDRGHGVAAGVYWSKLVAGDFVRTRTLTCLR